MANAILSSSMTVPNDSHSPMRLELLRLVKRLAIALVLLIATVLLFTQRERLVALVDHPIEKLQVSGAFSHLDTVLVNEALSDFVGRGFFATDLDQFKAQVENLPWVHSVTVSRVWPGQINLFISEQEATGVWNGIALINPEGELFTPEKIPATLASLPVLHGNEGLSNDRRTAMIDMFQGLDEKFVALGQGLESIELNARNAWELILKSDISIALGAIDVNTPEGVAKLEMKMERVGKVFSTRANLDLAKIKRIDARYPNGVAIKWRNTEHLIAKKGRL